MLMLRMRRISSPMRMVSPRCSMGGLAMKSLMRFSGLAKPMPEARASAWMCTLPSEVPVMETSPDVLLSSRRRGPLTLSVRSKLPVAAGPMAQPALARAAKSNVRGTVTARLRRFIITPREFRRSLRMSPKRYGDGRNYVPKGGAYSRALWLEGFVQGALAVAFEVEGDVGEACVFERLRDGGGHFGGQRAGHFFRCDFDARELVVQAHAELLEAEMGEGRFAALDEA